LILNNQIKIEKFFFSVSCCITITDVSFIYDFVDANKKCIKYDKILKIQKCLQVVI
jgi:hypothetical protein